MDPERWQQIKTILDASIDKTPEELSGWLDEVCAGDVDLRNRVDKLLSYEDRLEVLNTASSMSLFPPSDRSAVGRQIGPYRIRELLARGGMGAVYRAERTEGFHQTVALKLMRAGIKSRHALDRFHREREILAALEHSNIARLLDGATGADGRPYFAMELVDGEPVDLYCDQHRLGPRQRVELLLPVCQALRYAHGKLVIHRDLKPGNILVDRQGIPKLLDFGIAKLMESGVEAAKISDLVMTPRYASPEQFQGEPVATASDVYSIGVVLYQLLTGHLPCGLDTCGLGHVPQAVCELDPEPPSEVVSETVELIAWDRRESNSGWDDSGGQRSGSPTDSGERLTPAAVAAARGCRPQELRRQLRGDLDAIVLKALRKEPEQRYASMERLAADLRRYLDGYPVAARRGTWTFAYRAGKFVRRYRPQVVMVTAMLLMIFGFTGLLVQQLGRTERERDRAQMERDRAEQVSNFMIDLFRAAEPDRTRAEPSVRSLVDVGRQRLEDELEEVPEVRAELLYTLGAVYDRLGHYGAAGETLDASLDTLRQVHTGDHEDVARALNDLAVQAYRRGDYDRSERYSRECIAMRERLGLVSDLIKPRANLAAILRLRGQLDEAADVYRQGLEQRRARWGDRHPNVATSLSNLGFTHYLAGQFDAAEPLLREALEIRRAAFEPGSAKIASVLGHLARVHHARGQLDAAESLYLEALDIRYRRLGSGHSLVATLEKDFAALLLERGDLETAGAVLEHALSTLYGLKPEGDPMVAEAESVYGAYLAARGHRLEAEVCLRASLETLETVGGPSTFPARQARLRLQALQ